jgi:hypothetical protein
VRGSGALALPPLPHCGCAYCARNPRRGHHEQDAFPVALSDFFWACATQSRHVPYQRGQPPPIVTRSIEEQSEENGGNLLGLFTCDPRQQADAQCRICERSSALVEQLNHDSAPPTLSLLNYKPTAATLSSSFHDVRAPLGVSPACRTSETGRLLTRLSLHARTQCSAIECVLFDFEERA